MTEQSSDSQRYSFPAEGELPGEDDMQVAPDEAMTAHADAAGDPEQVDPGGYPHAPSRDVPRLATDPTGTGPDHPLPQPGMPAGPGEHNAQVEPADEADQVEKGSA
jgi:hypothetical protein